MGPYKKVQDSRVYDDGWRIMDGDDHPIADLDTETMADVLLAGLLGIFRKKPPQFEAGVSYIGDQRGEGPRKRKQADVDRASG